MPERHALSNNSLTRAPPVQYYYVSSGLFTHIYDRTSPLTEDYSSNVEESLEVEAATKEADADDGGSRDVVPVPVEFERSSSTVIGGEAE